MKITNSTIVTVLADHLPEAVEVRLGHLLAAAKANGVPADELAGVKAALRKGWAAFKYYLPTGERVKVLVPAI